MKRLIGVFGATLLRFFAFPQFAFATHINNQPHVVNCPQGQFKALCEITGARFGETLGALVTFAFIFAIIVALAFLIYGGVKWMVSGGDKTALEEARNHIVAAIVGLVIVFLVYFILNLVVTFFTGTGITNINIPTLPGVTPQPTPST